MSEGKPSLRARIEAAKLVRYARPAAAPELGGVLLWSEDIRDELLAALPPEPCDHAVLAATAARWRKAGVFVCLDCWAEVRIP